MCLASAARRRDGTPRRNRDVTSRQKGNVYKKLDSLGGNINLCSEKLQAVLFTYLRRAIHTSFSFTDSFSPFDL